MCRAGTGRRTLAAGGADEDERLPWTPNSKSRLTTPPAQPSGGARRPTGEGYGHHRNQAVRRLQETSGEAKQARALWWRLAGLSRMWCFHSLQATVTTHSIVPLESALVHWHWGCSMLPGSEPCLVPLRAGSPHTWARSWPAPRRVLGMRGSAQSLRLQLGRSGS